MSAPACPLLPGVPWQVLEGGFATFLVPVPGPSSGQAAGTNFGASAAMTTARGDVDSDWANGGSSSSGVPLMPVAGASNREAADGSGGQMNTMMAVALSGDMRSHMQTLRTQSIRSLTAPLLPLPQLVPSVSSSTPTACGQVSNSAVSRSRGNSQSNGYPLSSPMVSTMEVAALGMPGGMRDLCDAVLTDVGCSTAVKRQAAALKDALSALELVPRGPAELAGRHL